MNGEEDRLSQAFEVGPRMLLTWPAAGFLKGLGLFLVLFKVNLKVADI
jgi:hypothetical protein